MSSSLSPSPLLQLPNTYRAFYGGFPHLHPIQRQAIEPLLQGRDLILQAATGTGKTEAVLAPCVERMIQSGRAEAILYIVPTRALAVDLERRLDPVFGRLGLRLSVRTGDLKRTGGGRPDLLLTTPESLDVALGSANPDLRGLMQRARVAIIDEVHPLLHSYRGQQLAYLLQRLERRLERPLQKIALSATIADAEAVVRFFGFQDDAVRLLAPVQRRIVPHLIHLKDEESELIALLDDLQQTWSYRKLLFFANSRSRCDQLFGLLSRHGPFREAAELHYSNLQPRERRGVERRFRERDKALCIATSTLELGIDIGDVDGVILYEPPDSAASLVQRIGRANRRQESTHFWGICRGERAGRQLLRFLALLRLARQGDIESPLPGPRPSVLIQQILSCLYEKKRISLPALQDLFPEQPQTLASLWGALVQRRWLRPEPVGGLFRGGRPYVDCLLDRRIWSNFPEQEEEFALELDGETVADLPQSIVRQLEAGDRVLLTGKRLQILQIDVGERRRVLARTADRLDDKDLFWLGPGFQVSHEVAQAVRAALCAPPAATDGLFSRTRALLQTAQEQGKQTVTLANGVEVGRSPGGLYRHWTFLGSIGNLILQWTVERDLGPREADLTILADETGLDCSHCIDFQQLRLPVDQEGFHRWVEQHLEPLTAFFPLNAFCQLLPRQLLVEELTGFLFDPRLTRAFSRYQEDSSEIVAGDPAILDQPAETGSRAPTLLALEIRAEPLLDWEKGRWASERPRFVLDPEARHAPRALTGTLVGEYIRHRQCPRWLSSSFLPVEQRPPEHSPTDAEMGRLRTERGGRYEEQVLARLRQQSAELLVVEDRDARGRLRPLQERGAESLEKLRDLARRAAADPGKPRYLSQAVLVLPSVLERQDVWTRQVDGIGIPDLIRVETGPEGTSMEVGDIKDSRFPFASQQWQVAYYHLLLTGMRCLDMLPMEADIASSGFLIVRPLRDTEEPARHTLDLHDYAAAFPALLRNLEEVLLHIPSAATYQLAEHCPTCPFFDSCYREALEIEDLLFLPQLTAGTLEKLRQLGLRNLQDAGEWLAQPSPDNPFSPSQRERLTGRLTALRANRIGLRERRTRLFPVNLSIAIFFHMEEDPLSGKPRLWGWRALDRDGNRVAERIWTVTAEEELPEIWRESVDPFLQLWSASVENGRGPHLFHFGEPGWQALQTWGEGTGLDFLWTPDRLYHTDLRRLLAAHFDLPVPGRLTLFAVGRLLGLEPELDPPESLFHADAALSGTPWEQEEKRQEEATRLAAHLSLQAEIWRWASVHLESEWTQQNWETASGEERVPGECYLAFLDEEKRLREEDILALQEYPLSERVERFRSIGPLAFSGTQLDAEGRFLYGFETAAEAGLSKFREGDFLRLAPVGAPDLQAGYPVILADYPRHAGRLRVRSRRGRLALNQRLAYSLEEDLTDWTGPRLVHAVREVFTADRPHRLAGLLAGNWPLERDAEESQWVRKWLRKFGPLSGLNPTQQQALVLPFQHRLSLIEGPPGTGKTHLLGWILIALIQRAREAGRPLRIAVSALTHQAIDQVLKKVVALVGQHQLEFPGACFKWGRWTEDEAAGERRVEQLISADELAEHPHAIVGATGFGLYQLFEGQKGDFPQVFDWIVFDEASQVLVPQSLLALLYGRGNFLFSGDVRQLPPIVLGKYEEDPEYPFRMQRSILSHLLDRYGPAPSVRLDLTYRMNAEICAFPSRTWYAGALHPAPANARARLVLKGPRRNDLLDRVLDPEKPVALLIVDHRGCHQKADLEVEIVAQLAHRLIGDHGLGADQLALISPHRAQNSATAERLGQLLGDDGEDLPLIDTVERVQGAERKVIVFAFTTSDPDHLTSEFLNSPNRFNVALTRAREKLIVVGSRAFFAAIPHEEEALAANCCFKEFYEFCREQDGLFFWEDDADGRALR